MFTNTPDKHFILDHLPGNSKVWTLITRPQSDAGLVVDIICMHCVVRPIEM